MEMHNLLCALLKKYCCYVRNAIIYDFQFAFFQSKISCINLSKKLCNVVIDKSYCNLNLRLLKEVRQECGVEDTSSEEEEYTSLYFIVFILTTICDSFYGTQEDFYS